MAIDERRTAAENLRKGPPQHSEAVAAAHREPHSGEDKGSDPRRPALVELIELRDAAPTDDDLKRLIHAHVAEEIAKEGIADHYHILVAYDNRQIERSDTDKIYRAVSGVGSEKPILLVIDSGGGSISPAYFIAKLCREYSADHFSIAVPRRAKSAATLICCGADRIHMGSLSELGPIDPQFDGVPALALKQSIEHLAELAKRHPSASDMFASYLARSLRIEALGYYERVAESAMHYAQLLLRSRRKVARNEVEIAAIANRLVYAYKDHGFAIDAAEATDIFGADVVSVNSAEYKLGNRLYVALDMLEYILARFFERDFAFMGGLGDGAVAIKRPTA